MLVHIQRLFSIFLWYGGVVVFLAGCIFALPPSSPLGARLLEMLITFFSSTGVSFVVLGPSDGFLVQIYLALGLGLLLGLPYLARELYAFSAPGLYHEERKFFLIVFVISLVLFFLGALFGLAVVAPPSLKILVSFNAMLDVQSLYSVRDFIGDLFALILFSGIAFMLPVAMVLLSRFRIVVAHTWLSVWRYFILLVLLVSAIITPDGTGVTMMLFSAPLVALYFAGAFFAIMMRPRT